MRIEPSDHEIHSFLEYAWRLLESPAQMWVRNSHLVDIFQPPRACDVEAASNVRPGRVTRVREQPHVQNSVDHVCLALKVVLDVLALPMNSASLCSGKRRSWRTVPLKGFKNWENKVTSTSCASIPSSGQKGNHTRCGDSHAAGRANARLRWRGRRRSQSGWLRAGPRSPPPSSSASSTPGLGSSTYRSSTN